MKDLLENLKKRLADEETIRYLKFMVIPLVVIILIIVIVVADRPQGEEGELTEAVSQIEIGTAEATEEEKTGDTEDTAYHLEEAGEEIRSLMGLILRREGPAISMVLQRYTETALHRRN